MAQFMRIFFIVVVLGLIQTIDLQSVNTAQRIHAVVKNKTYCKLWAFSVPTNFILLSSCM